MIIKSSYLHNTSNNKTYSNDAEYVQPTFNASNFTHEMDDKYTPLAVY